MPFDPEFRSKYEQGDFFYGLDKPRRALMDKLNAPWDRVEGTVINFYNIGDYAQSVTAPPKNEEFPTAVAASSNPKHKELMAKLQAKPGFGDNAIWKRKSKAGLWWATQRVQKHVHFCLDGLVLQQVVGKSFPGNSVGAGADTPSGPDRKSADWTSKSTSITGAELRWIFRNRKDEGVRKHIQFWENGSPCGPPWERAGERDLWNNYKNMD